MAVFDSLLFGQSDFTVEKHRQLHNQTPDFGPTSNPGAIIYTGVELYHPASTPYIDFHRGASPAGDSNADFNVRLINDAGNQLGVYSIAGTDSVTLNVGGHITFPNTARRDKVVLYSGYYIGIDPSAMYFISTGGIYAFEAPAGSWAMRYGPTEVNGGERGLWVSGNDQATERYAGGWFRSMNSGNGWYHQVHGSGWYMYDSWVRSYLDHTVFTNNTTGFRGNVANIGAQAYSDHAEFGHNNNFGSAAGFAYLAKWDGHAYMNTPGGELHFHSNNNMMAHWYAGGNFYFTLAGFTGAAVIWASGSQQMGWNSSSARVKRSLSEAKHEDDNPIFKMKTRRYHWEETRIRNGDEYNKLNPEGIMGLFAEEVCEVAPDAVHLDKYGIAMSLDTNAMLGYLVDAVQHCRQLINEIDEKGK